MAEQRRAQLNRSMEKSFEDLLTGLDDDLEPDIDDIFTNCDHLPEKVTDATFNAMAFQQKDKKPSPVPSPDKEEREQFQFPKVSKSSPEEPQEEDLEDVQLPRAERNTDPGIQSESEEEQDRLPEELEFVSSKGNGEGEVYDATKLIMPTFGESSTDDTLLGKVELEDDEEEDDMRDEEEDEEDDMTEEGEEEEDDMRDDEDEEGSVEEEEMEDQKQASQEDRRENTKDLTMFSGLDHDDSDPDIDKLVAECDFLPETVSDSTINAMVDRNRPLAKSYRQSLEIQSEDQDNEETMETDIQQEEHSPPPDVLIRIQKEESLDFSVLEPDNNHLDVDIGKQKTNLRKQGSLAKRRKPTRSTVRSALLSGEEAMFQDSTEPKTERADSKGEDDVFGQRSSSSSVEGVPTSPPAKKPSKVMVPLPGFGGPKPELRKKSEEQHEAEMAVDEPKKKDYKSYGVKLPVPPLPRKSESESTEETISKPVLRKVPRKDSVERQEPEKLYDVSSLKSVNREDKVSKTDDSDKFLEKPSLRQVKRDENKGTISSENTFEKPTLKNVSRPSVDKSSESDMKFEIPALNKVSRERNESNKTDQDSENVYDKSSLRSTPKPPDKQSTPTSPKTPEPKPFALPALRPTPRANRGRQEDTTSQQDTGSFEKPALRNVSRPLERKGSVESGSFEKPTLRNVGKPPLPEKRISISEDSSEEKHKFDMPALRMVPKDQRPTQTLRNVVGQEKDSETEAIRRPSLKSTPQKEIPKSEESKEAPSWLKNMKLRKTKSQAEDINNVGETKEKPEWLQTANEKREKAMETLNSKENLAKNSSESNVSWLSRDNLKKTATPLQENNDNLHSNQEEGRKRLSSLESNGDIDCRSRERTPARNSRQNGQRENYVPSWLKAKDNHHKSNPNLNFVTPSSNSDEPPDWKKALAEKRKNRRDSDTPVKQSADTEKGIPPWKQELAQKGMKSSTPLKTSSDQKKAEPEWKQKADEKRQRIIKTGLFDKTLRKT
ncbi:nucleolar protein dao-5-like isoform X2 [Saccostrea echinata]|uniref:nucleolar protein dao-5-like isoform X2 n=1 Tax=Saccostrea echinata TaxID=191078 RepID=UPI002A828E57|nr:nucleolar protein dao-5-like isoform X2 [Saccostrea echinata]